jgi:hypothetical protein
MARVEKWKTAFEGVDTTDVDAVAEVYWTELYSKLDPSTL